jgi:hypothetical protein
MTLSFFTVAVVVGLPCLFTGIFTVMFSFTRPAGVLTPIAWEMLAVVTATLPLMPLGLEVTPVAPLPPTAALDGGGPLVTLTCVLTLMLAPEEKAMFVSLLSVVVVMPLPAPPVLGVVPPPPVLGVVPPPPVLGVVPPPPAKGLLTPTGACVLVLATWFAEEAAALMF